MLDKRVNNVISLCPFVKCKTLRLKKEKFRIFTSHKIVNTFPIKFEAPGHFIIIFESILQISVTFSESFAFQNIQNYKFRKTLL